MITIVHNLFASVIILTGIISSKNEELSRKIENDKMLKSLSSEYVKNKFNLAFDRGMCASINEDNGKKDFVIFFEENITKNGYSTKKGWGNGEWKFESSTPSRSGDDDTPSSIITEIFRIGCSTKNSGHEEREYRYSWEHVFEIASLRSLPQEIRKKAFLVFPWTTAKIKSIHHNHGDDNASVDLYIKTKSGEEIKAIINLKTKDEDGNTWVLTWAPLKEKKDQK